MAVEGVTLKSDTSRIQSTAEYLDRAEEEGEVLV